MPYLEIIGIVLILAGSAVGLYILLKKQKQSGALTFCITVICAGIAVFFGHRITEFEFLGTKLKAATEQATIDASQIRELKNRIQAQSATVDAVAKVAADAEKSFASLQEKTNEVETKLSTLDSISAKNEQKTVALEDVLKQAGNKINEMHQQSDLMYTSLAALSGDRNAFDRLAYWKNNWKELSMNPILAGEANRMWYAVLIQHDGLEILPQDANSVPPLIFPGRSFSDLNLNQIKHLYYASQNELGSCKVILGGVWNRTDFEKVDKLDFFAEVLKYGYDLDSVEYAARRFRDESKLDYKYLLVGYYLNWWEKNRAKYLKGDSPIQSNSPSQWNTNSQPK